MRSNFPEINASKCGTSSNQPYLFKKTEFYCDLLREKLHFDFARYIVFNLRTNRSIKANLPNKHLTDVTVTAVNTTTVTATAVTIARTTTITLATVVTVTAATSVINLIWC